MKTLILASQSPARAALLEQIGYKFTVMPSEYDEDMTLDMPAEDLIKLLAKGKADDVASKVTDSVIVAADSFIVINGTPIGKPHTPERAKEVLGMLRGTTNTAWTGFCVIDQQTGAIVNEARSCKVTFRDMTDEEIDKYVRTEEPLEKGGAYAAMLKGGAFVDHCEGDWYAAIGLPLSRLTVVLDEFGIPLPW